MTSRPPHIASPRTAIDYVFEGLAVLGLLLLVLLPSFSWSSLPERIPTHFNASGEADAWGDRAGIFILPSVAFVMYLIISVAACFPARLNYLWEINERNAARQYQLARRMLLVLKFEVTWLMLYIVWMTIQVAHGHKSGLGAAFLPIFGVAFLGTFVWYFVRGLQER